MRVARIELKQIGPFEDAVLEIPAPAAGQRGELVIFEGPNGSGKTTIAESISSFSNSDEFVQRLPQQGEAEDLCPPIRQFVQRFRSEGEASVRIEHGDFWWRTYGFKPGRAGPWDGTPGPAFPPSPRRSWAAFAYKGHQPTPVITTKGPAEIDAPPLRGALSFGAVEPASAHFGQLLVNLDQEVAKAFREAHRDGLPAERRQELERLAGSRQRMLDDIARAISEVLCRKVTFEVPIGQHAPTVLVDGESIPLDLLGEGMRSTLAWLSDLLVRLHRIPWEDTARSPLEQDFWLILDEIDESLRVRRGDRLHRSLDAGRPARTPRRYQPAAAQGADGRGDARGARAERRGSEGRERGVRRFERQAEPGFWGAYERRWLYETTGLSVDPLRWVREKRTLADWFHEQLRAGGEARCCAY